tara:strand:- start:111 stop:308 length:198 start_codon:yes stop_codon:yes gene_type:complete
MDDLQKTKRELAIKQHQILCPDVHPVLIGWVFDYIQEIGEEEFEKRIKLGYWDKKVDHQKEKSVL